MKTIEIDFFEYFYLNKYVLFMYFFNNMYLYQIVVRKPILFRASIDFARPFLSKIYETSLLYLLTRKINLYLPTLNENISLSKTFDIN
jgi:hypothetical protein